MKNDKSQFVVRTFYFYLSSFICHWSLPGSLRSLRLCGECAWSRLGWPCSESSVGGNRNEPVSSTMGSSLVCCGKCRGADLPFRGVPSAQGEEAGDPHPDTGAGGAARLRGERKAAPDPGGCDSPHAGQQHGGADQPAGL